MEYIFIHGLGQDSSSWNDTISSIIKPINAKKPNLFALLNNEESNYTNLYRVFSDYCETFSEPLNLCGLSLGGILALNYAIDNPEKIQSLVLIGTQYKMPKMLLKLQNIIFKIMPEFFFKKNGVQKQEFIKNFMGLMNTMLELDFSENLKDILCDTLVICGDKDAPNKKAAEYLAQNIARAEYKILKNTGHEVNADNPVGLAAVLEAFYRRVAGNSDS